MVTRKLTLTRPRRSYDEGNSEEGVGKRDKPPSPLYRGGGGALPPQVVVPTEKMKVEQALALLDQFDLTHKELRQYYDQVAIRLQDLATSGAADTRNLELWATAAYDALVRANGGTPAGMPGPLVVRRVLAVRSSWQYIEDFLDALGVDGMKVATRLSLLRLLASLLVTRCQGIARHAHIPLNAKLVANNCSDIAAVFEDAFPGYLGAGLIPLLVKRLTEGGTDAHN